jgi:hypothetical protein
MKSAPARTAPAAIAGAAALLFLAPVRTAEPEGAPDLVFSCRPGNDLFWVLRAAGIRCDRRDSPADAVAAARQGAAVLVLAEDYPGKATVLDPAILAEAKGKGLRVYIEFPAALPGLDVGAPRRAGVERAVIASDFFGPALPRGRILAIHGLHFTPLRAEKAAVVAARVAGFDEAVFGLPAETWPILFEAPGGGLLVATTKLSGFVTGRSAPRDAWEALWAGVLRWLRPGVAPPAIAWTPTVRPAYGPRDPLPPDAEAEALRRGVEWFPRSKLLLHPSRLAEVDRAALGSGLLPAPPPGAPSGDGSLGILEAPLSIIGHDGSQMQSVSRRGDCTGEAAMALALGGKVLGSPEPPAVARRLLDFWHLASDARKKERGDPSHGAYGLIAWGVGSPAWYVANYGDDNARLLLGTLAAAAVLGEDRWDEAAMMCLLANLRTTGRLGFRGDRIDIPELAGGWERFFRRSIVSKAPHFEAHLWACFLWAYHQTGDRLFLDRARSAIRITMDAYPGGWRWTNGLAQERARILLPLAWLVRVEDAPEHRAWLRKAVGGLLSLQDGCGAIREELGPPGQGMMPPPASNEAYGTAEASLIQANGDPVADLLYTTNFAFLGLHEAAAAGDGAAREGEEKLARFLVRIQVRSEEHPSLDGGWFRAFDFRRWEHWGSNADAGWGAWSIESGWTQGWITAVLALRRLGTSFWDLTEASRIERHHPRLREAMIPRSVEESLAPKKVGHAALGKEVRLAEGPDPRYFGSGAGTLTDGILAPPDHASGEWIGLEGPDLDATVDLGEEREVRKVTARFLQSVAVGIFRPERVEVSLSSDGRTFRPAAAAEATLPAREPGPVIAQVTLAVEGRARFVRVRARSIGTIPEWHAARGLRAWLFADEVLVDP